MLNIIYQSQLFGKTIAIFGVQVQKRQKNIIKGQTISRAHYGGLNSPQKTYKTH